MKKLFNPFLIAFLLISMSAEAQIEKMPLGNKTSYIVSSTQWTKSVNTIPTVSKAVFYEDFEGYDDVFDPSVWEVMRSSDATGFDLAAASSPMWFLCKPSNFNGNGSNYIFSGLRSAAISYIASQVTWLITKEPIKINSEGLSLNFWLYYLNNPSQEINTHLHVMIKAVDDSEWFSLASWDEESSSNQFEEFVSIEIPLPYTGKDIQIAFAYENIDNTGFQVAIDNISIGNIDAPDLQISAFHYPYSMVPKILANTFNYDLKAYIHNAGSNYEGEGGVAKVEINPFNNFVSLLDIDMEIQAGSSKFLTFPDKPNFTEKGNYTIEYSIEFEDGVDKNQSSFTFKITENTLATDYCSTLGVAGGFSAGKDISFGNRYQINSEVIVTGLQIYWPEFEEADKFFGQIYEYNPYNNSVMLIYQKEFTKAIDHSNQEVNYPIEPLYLSPGAHFFVAINQFNGSPINVGFDKVSNGQFWRIRNDETLDLVSSPTIGNLAIRLQVEPPVASPTLTFLVKSNEKPLEGASIVVEGFEPFVTNQNGIVSTDIENGIYSYSINKSGYSTVLDQIIVNNSSPTLEINMLPEQKVTFNILTSNDQPLEGAEILLFNRAISTNNYGLAEIMLPVGEHSYTVLLDGYSPTKNGFDLFQDTTITLNLFQASTVDVTFEIVSNQLDQGIADANIELVGYGLKYTNSNGQASFSGILPNENGLYYKISKNGYKNISGLTPPFVNEVVIVKDTLNIITYYLQVEVSDMESLQKINEAKVMLKDYGEKFTDTAGVIVFDELIPGNNFELTISKEGYITSNRTLSLYNTNIRIAVALEPISSSILLSDVSPFVIYPNPSNGEFSITGKGTYGFNIYDITGRLIHKSTNNAGTAPINISSEPKGLYIIKIFNEELISTHKLVKH